MNTHLPGHPLAAIQAIGICIGEYVKGHFLLISANQDPQRIPRKQEDTKKPRGSYGRTIDCISADRPRFDCSRTVCGKQKESEVNLYNQNLRSN